MKDIGIMGGAFSPPHLWHLNLGEWAYYKFSLSTVLYVPSGNPPHKKDVLDKEIRFRLVQAAVKGNPHFEASRIEIDREGVSWTIDTFKELKKLHGDVRLNFIMGADNVENLVKYDRCAEFQSLARLLVSSRGTKSDPAELAAWRKALPHGEVEFLPCPASTLASKDIRKAIEAGEPYRYYVPSAVYDLIEAEGLYKAIAAKAA